MSCNNHTLSAMQNNALSIIQRRITRLIHKPCGSGVSGRSGSRAFQGLVLGVSSCGFSVLPAGEDCLSTRDMGLKP